MFSRFRATALLLLVAYSASAQTNVFLTDTNIEYIGRWDKSGSTTYRSHWDGYLRVRFTGTTVAVKEATAINIWADIDGTGYTKFAGGSGTVNVTPTPLSSGTHVLTVLAALESDELQFQGLTLSSGGATVPPVASNKPLIEFIGDSITVGAGTPKVEPDAYAWRVCEQLNYNHAQIAFQSITLVDGYHYANNTLRGQSYQYFIAQEPNSPVPNVDWNFTNYIPRIVVINLGTNDRSIGVPLSIFQATNITFLQNIRARLPNATIIMLRPFNGSYAAQILNAVNNRNNGGDQNVIYVNTTGWISGSPFGAGYDTSDGIHPTQAGHQKIANLLAPILTGIINNHPPVAGSSFTMGALVGIPSTVKIVGGNHAPSDPDNDALKITSVSGYTNAIVTTDGTNITYTATNGTMDSFNYTVNDGHGGTASQIVNVTISSGQGYNRISTEMVGEQMVLTYLGMPGNNYALDWAGDLTPPIDWMGITTNPASANGWIAFTNPSSFPSGFFRYRLVQDQ